MKDQGADAVDSQLPLRPPSAIVAPAQTVKTAPAKPRDKPRGDHQHLADSQHHRQKMEAIARLAGGVAHEFNNILTVIRGYSEYLLESTAAHDEMRAEAEAIEEAVQRAASLTRQLLTFARRAIVELKLFDLNAVVLENQDKLMQLVGRKVRLSMRLAAGAAPVLADRAQIDQLLVNLATNARDAMPSGGQLRIETAEVETAPGETRSQSTNKRGRFVRLVVADNGRGMTDEVKSHLFEPFYSTKKSDRGAGLGLATVYGIVKQSGGHVRVLSRCARGTRVEVYLPLATSTAHGQSEEHALPSARGGTETVLVVEDEDDVRIMVVRALQKLGYQVLNASNGVEALRIVERLHWPIDLLVTDIMMPGINGRQLGARLCRQFPALVVLYTSGYTDNELIPNGVQDPDTAFLQKPYASAALVAKVRELLDARAAVRSSAGARRSGPSAILP